MEKSENLFTRMEQMGMPLPKPPSAPREAEETDPETRREEEALARLVAAELGLAWENDGEA